MERTKDFPPFPKPLPVLRVNHVHDGVAVIIVSGPYRPYSPLSSEVEKVENGRGKKDLAH